MTHLNQIMRRIQFLACMALALVLILLNQEQISLLYADCAVAILLPFIYWCPQNMDEGSKNKLTQFCAVCGSVWGLWIGKHKIPLTSQLTFWIWLISLCFSLLLFYYHEYKVEKYFRWRTGRRLRLKTLMTKHFGQNKPKKP